jgi:hypothetical protein
MNVWFDDDIKNAGMVERAVMPRNSRLITNSSLFRK